MIADNLRHIDYHALAISDYSRSYILRLLPNLDYYLDIYRHCIERLLTLLRRQPAELTVVDYGGGHGFLSCLLKQRGFGRVIYIDYNPQAAETVAAIKQQLGYGPDVILQGDAATLRQWCHEHGTQPDGLLGMDVIEHIYRLDTFFDDLYAIGPMPMIFTTGSTPYNPHVVRRLHKVMRADEQGHNGQPGFYQLRRQYIAEQRPQLSEEQLDYWAQHTRGLQYGDLLSAVDSNAPFPVNDPYNTCDPATGSWTERILPLSAYQALLSPHAAQATVSNGFYNTHRSSTQAPGTNTHYSGTQASVANTQAPDTNTHRSSLKVLSSQILNGLLRSPSPLFRPLAPFIILTLTKTPSL